MAEEMKRVPFVLSESLLRRVDAWWHAEQLPSRAEAIRRLIQAGLATERAAEPGRPSARKGRRDV